jgi:hypothetical protein
MTPHQQENEESLESYILDILHSSLTGKQTIHSFMVHKTKLWYPIHIGILQIQSMRY